MRTHKLFSCFAAFFLFLGFSASSSISGGIFTSSTATGRNLLQAQKACPVSFEYLNYTIITSQCKGPKFPAKDCCSAFKELACPYAQHINDLTTDCATILFSYINIYGKYPPGLFSSECREGKEGLACPALPPSASQNANGGDLRICNPSLRLMAAACFLVFLFMLL
ncbi:LORELEI-LIKE-GPI-ANCHORED PROTEIN 1 [Hibiscus trionum]|uniref:LORELEI-LIKE-GPI-ANCHORED PROTEIN 1 n=1 Tax=Hibiscus trionum TaxID=183268 RepID=A0A9W7JLU6_HIBTR|nr:LORELEI-LIKE-GPI-ANCHORED PROTEIN 1 [Hibiscus trionum]